MSGSEKRFAMTVCPDDALKASHREVQRLLGQCLLRLQAYELLIKTLVAQHEISGSAPDLEAVRAARGERVSRNTLGMLVRAFLGSYLVAGDGKTAPEPELASPEGLPSVSCRFWVELTEADYAEAATDLRELVQLRNTLVHQFVEQQDFGSLEGCHRAEEALVAASDRIGESYERLKGWAEDMRKTQEILQSDEVREVVTNELMAALLGGDRRH